MTPAYCPKPGCVVDRALKILEAGAMYCIDLAAKLGITPNSLQACLKKPVEVGIVIKTWVADMARPRGNALFRLAADASGLMNAEGTYRAKALKLLREQPLSAVALAEALSTTSANIRGLMRTQVKAGVVAQITMTSEGHQGRMGYRMLKTSDDADTDESDDDGKPVRRRVIVSKITPTEEARYWANPFGRPVPASLTAQSS